MLKILILSASATLLPLSIFAGVVATNLTDLPPLHIDSRSDGVRPLVFGPYRALA